MMRQSTTELNAQNGVSVFLVNASHSFSVRCPAILGVSFYNLQIILMCQMCVMYSVFFSFVSLSHSRLCHLSLVLVSINAFVRPLRDIEEKMIVHVFAEM